MKMAFQKQWFIINTRVKLCFSLGTKDEFNTHVLTHVPGDYFCMVSVPHVSQILALWTSCTQACQADEHKANRWTGKGSSELDCIFRLLH